MIYHYLCQAQNADQAAMLVFVQEQRINELNAHNNELKVNKGLSYLYWYYHYSSKRRFFVIQNIITSTNTMFGAVFTELTGIIGVQSAQ